MNRKNNNNNNMLHKILLVALNEARNCVERSVSRLNRDLWHASKNGKIYVKSMQRSGTESIRTQIEPSKQKREITNIIVKTQREHDQSNKKASQKASIEQPNRTKNNMNTHKVKRHLNSVTPKTGNGEPQQKYRFETINKELIGN